MWEGEQKARQNGGGPRRTTGILLRYRFNEQWEEGRRAC